MGEKKKEKKKKKKSNTVEVRLQHITQLDHTYGINLCLCVCEGTREKYCHVEDSRTHLCPEMRNNWSLLSRDHKHVHSVHVNECVCTCAHAFLLIHTHHHQPWASVHMRIHTRKHKTHTHHPQHMCTNTYIHSYSTQYMHLQRHIH